MWIFAAFRVENRGIWKTSKTSIVFPNVFLGNKSKKACLWRKGKTTRLNAALQWNFRACLHSVFSGQNNVALWNLYWREFVL